MPRKRRDEETILAFWKQFARDKNCPWMGRIWCTFALAVATKMIPATIPPPGVARYRESNPPPPVTAPAEATPEQVEAESEFLKQLRDGGADANNS